MNPTSVMKWGLAVSLVFAAGAIWGYLLRTSRSDDPSTRGSDDRSVMLTEPFRTVRGRIIENGSAFDKAAVDIGNTKRLVLPQDARVRRRGEAGRIQIFTKKTLALHGHPPEPMSVRDARKNMGCAVKIEGDDLVIATFGEWDSHKEGSARMKLVVDVPKGVKVGQRKGLSGEESAGQEQPGEHLPKPKDAKGGYWYGPTSPAQGWKAVPDIPDPDRTAD